MTFSGFSPGRAAVSRQLGTHVLLVQLLDAVPVQVQFLGDILDRRAATPATDAIGEPLRVVRVVGEEVEPLALHRAAAPTPQATDLHVEEDALVGRRQIAHPSMGAVVPREVARPADAADRFFERRTRATTRAFGSPKTPHTEDSGRNPEKAYASSRRRRLRDRAIPQSCRDFSETHNPANAGTARLPATSPFNIHPHKNRKTQKEKDGWASLTPDLITFSP